MNLPQITALKIKKIQIQGAKAIAIASLLALKKYNIPKTGESLTAYKKRLGQAVAVLKSARPTEPLNQNCLKLLAKALKQNSIKKIRSEIIGKADFLLKTINDGDNKIIKYGEKIFKGKKNVFSHCHSSTVEEIIVNGYKSSKFKVYNTETRPLFQGRILAKNLANKHIPITMVGDSAAAFLISPASGKHLKMDLVLIGADALLPDGSAINKIGSFGISLAAFYANTPLYVVSHLLKCDDDGVIPIEIRPEEEIWPKHPKNLKIINFAFDKIPAKYITGIICEFGIIKPSQIKGLVAKHYPWILKRS